MKRTTAKAKAKAKAKAETKTVEVKKKVKVKVKPKAPKAPKVSPEDQALVDHLTDAIDAAQTTDDTIDE